MNSNDNCYSILTLLLTSFSLGKISKSNPSAWPLTLLPPFMWFPRANTSPKTLFTPELSSRAWKPRGRHTIKHTQRWWRSRSGSSLSRASYLADGGDRVELALDGQDPVSEGRAEDDAVSSARKVWDLRELVQEPGGPNQRRKSHQCFSLLVRKRGCDLNWCNFRGLDVKNPILTVQACPAASRPPPMTSRSVSWSSPARLAALADGEMWQGVIVGRGCVGLNCICSGCVSFDTYIFVQSLNGLQVHHRVIHSQYGCERKDESVHTLLS